MRVTPAALFVCAFVLGSAVPGFAQSAISGLVNDATGAVLPGVTVEASSPALIEQTRSVVTDVAGRYRIEDLRPGVYRVTFTLPGFNTLVREGITLESEFTATINAQLRVGGIEETITVSGASPVVDVQSTMSRSVVTQDQIEALPTGRSYQTLAATVPGLASSGAGRFDVGGASQTWQGYVTAYGSLAGDMAIEIDGMNVSSLLLTGNISGVYHNQGAYQEMSYQVVAGSAESQTGGVRVNMIPKEGGNRFTGDAVAIYSNRHLQSENVDARLAALNLTVPPNLYEIWDYNAGLGGPILRDRAWFFFSTRHWGASNYITNNFFADGSPAYDRTKIHAYTSRVTLQLTPKNKLTGMYDMLPKYRDYFGSESGAITLDGSGRQDMAGYDTQVKWTSTATSRLLIEAGFSQNFLGYNLTYQDDVARPGSGPTPFGDISKRDNVIPGRTTYNARETEFYNPFVAKQIVAGVSYVTGSHSVRVGTQWKFGWIKNFVTQNGAMQQVYNNGAPLQVRIYNTPLVSRSNLNADLGVYVQDSWRLGRLTLNPGLRFERFNAEVPAQSSPAGRFVPAREFAAIPNLPNFNNWVLRVGAAYDLTGDGRTAIKGSVGRYMQQDATSFPQRYNPMIQAFAPVSWTDLDQDDFADGERGCQYLTPGCEINFAQIPATFGVRRNLNPADDLERPYQLVYNLGVSRELRPGLGLSFNYYRRTFHDATFTTDLAKPMSVYTPYQIPDPRGNGQTITIYNILPAALATVNEIDTTSGDNTTVYGGFDIGVNARFGNGATVAGGTSTGRTVSRTCDVLDPNSLRHCNQMDYDVPLRTTVKFSGTYPLPFGVRLSGVFQSSAGDAITYTYNVTATAFRNFTGVAMGQPSVTVRLNEPGTAYRERVNQLDFTVAKAFSIGTRRITPELSLFNALNGNAMTSTSTAWPAIDRPLTILSGRLVRFGATVRF
jgi:hypothetical protein